jgi:hypothetical protein
MNDLITILPSLLTFILSLKVGEGEPVENKQLETASSLNFLRSDPNPYTPPRSKSKP